MPSISRQEAEAQYDAGIKEVKEILFSPATPDEKDVAKRMLDELTALRLRVNIEEVEGRTQLLSGLIQKLGVVIAGIETTSPLHALAERLTGIVNTSTTLVTNVREDFFPDKGSDTQSG